MATAIAITVGTALVTAGVTAGMSVLADQALPQILDWVDDKISGAKDEVTEFAGLSSLSHVPAKQGGVKSGKKKRGKK